MRIDSSSILNNTKYKSSSQQDEDLLHRINLAYKNIIITLVEWLDAHDCRVTAMVLAAFLHEPWQTMKASCLYPLGWKGHFDFFGMNPTELSQEQTEKRPILLIHGNYHNQSAWISLGEYLQSHHAHPVFTVNLPGGMITDADYALVKDKLAEIEALYSHHGIRDVTVDLVGHSRGGAIAETIACQSYASIGKVISLGNTAESDSDLDGRIYEIVGEYDTWQTAPSLLPSIQQSVVPMGHMELLSSPLTHRIIVQILQS